MADLLRDKRVLLSALVIALVSATFWTGSRYPSLNEKAALGGELALEDPLGFEPVLRFDPTAPFMERVTVTTVNWLHTNRQGMAFGVLLAAAFMTLVSLLRRTSFEGAFANTVLGVALGAPLGVCVNCAAPIASGLHASGARLETALAAMISSPTLNVVVLAMLFALFPPYLVVIKLGLTLLFLLVGIPVLSRLLFRAERLSADAGGRLATGTARGPALAVESPPSSLGWTAALRWVARELGRHLWFVTRTTVPLMLVAGVLGALAVTTVPWDMLADRLPHMGPLAIAASMAGLAVFGLMLPMPMALDVVVAAALLAGGVPVKYVGVLLFTLGIFSVYSFAIVGRAVSWRVASVLAVALFGLGLTSGAAAHLVSRRMDAGRRTLFLATFTGWDVERPPRATPPAEADDAALLAALRADAVVWEPVEAGEGTDRDAVRPIAAAPDPGIAVERLPFRRPEPGSGTGFTREDGAHLGLETTDDLPLVYKFTSPFYRNWPIASGDVHGDGWPDVLLGSGRGVVLFANRRGERFVRQPIPIPALRDLYVASCALVDLDADGWLDIFISAYRGGNFVVYNDQGRFGPAGLRALPPTEATMAAAVAFGDLDRSGTLDVVLGNWSAGSWTRVPPRTSRNVLLRNVGGRFEPEPLAEPTGETLSLLLSDVNMDGRLDLLVGNDFRPPDVFYLSGDAGLAMVTREAGIIPHSTRSTMSIDSADVDNDLRPEIFFAQTTGRSPDTRQRMRTRPIEDGCDEHDTAPARERCRTRVALHRVVAQSIRAREPSVCLAIDARLERADCIAFHMLTDALAGRYGNPELCARFPALWEPLQFICHCGLRARADAAPAEEAREIPQIFNSNVLLAPQAGGSFADHARAAGVDVTGWSWNAKFADLDQDEWQDLYVVNGYFPSSTREANVLFWGRGGRGFEDDGGASGLGSFLPTVAYTYVDFDGDGDLDVIEVSSDDPIRVYRNRLARGHAVTFELRDELGNAHGVGAQIIVHYGAEASRHQMREIKASGGFVSFDAPVAHFGLGTHREIQRVEVRWPTGEPSVLMGPFAADHRYRLHRLRRPARPPARRRAPDVAAAARAPHSAARAALAHESAHR